MENKFKDFKLSEEVKRALSDIGYEDATEIQSQAIPAIMEGRDLIGQSQTGTGKTASFGLPLIESINPNDRSVQGIILCPTRELAVQVAGELRKYTKYKDSIKMLAIYGGQDITGQIRDLKKGVQIVIGTPGRVMDHMRRRTLKLGSVKMVVLDEADEMLNMGFEEDIETILKDVPESRQTVLFSATMNPRIRNITKKYLKDPVNIKISSRELTVENIDQVLLDMKQGMKNESLTRLIDIHKPQKAIVFCNTKKKVDDLIEYLKRGGYKAEALHGDIKQSQRERIMKKLKQGEFQILVATDVAARGIDIQDLELVVNYDIPQEEEYYVHRIGRTGRNGQKGKAFTFVVGKERNKIYSIQKYANTKIASGKVPTITEVNMARNAEMVQKVQEIIDGNSFANTELFEELLRQNNDIKQVAKAILTLYTNSQRVVAPEPREERRHTEVTPDDRGNIKLFLNLGRKDSLQVKDVIGSMSANTAVSGSEIGKVNILDKFSFVEIPQIYVDEILSGMQGKQIKGRDVNIEIANH